MEENVRKELFWDRLIYSNIVKTNVTALYQAYLEFMNEHNDDMSYGMALPRKAFVQKLRDKNILVRNSNGNRLFAFGVKLKDEYIKTQEAMSQEVKKRVFEHQNPNMFTVTCRMSSGSMVVTMPAAFRKRFDFQEGETLICEFDGEYVKYCRYAAFEPKQEVVRD